MQTVVRAALSGSAVASPPLGADEPAVQICLLGGFRLIGGGEPIVLRGGGKTEALLTSLALRRGHAVPRETLLETLWPGSEGALAVQSLRTLTHALYKLLGERLGGAPPVLRRGGAYQLNTGAGIGVDIVTFEALAASGHLRATRGEAQAAAGLYVRASMMYAGDLCIAGDVHALIERERLRGLYLNVLAQLADHFFQADEYVESLEYAQALLGSEPCREDAHRLAMRCYLRMGQRTQALRQYRLCVDILRAEFDAAPELSTSDLYERMRHQPNSL